MGADATKLRRRALLVFLTALDDPLLAESFERNAGLLCRQHLMLVNMIQPPGVRPLFGNANVKTAIRKMLCKYIKAGSRWHCSSYGDDFVIFFCLLN